MSSNGGCVSGLVLMKGLPARLLRLSFPDSSSEVHHLVARHSITLLDPVSPVESCQE